MVNRLLASLLLLSTPLIAGCAESKYRNVKTTEVNWPNPPSFTNCWEDTEKRFYAPLFWQMPDGSMPHCNAEGTYLPVNDDPDMVLTVLIPSEDEPTIKSNFMRQGRGAARPRPAMRLAISSLLEVSNERGQVAALLPATCGNPPIECDLNLAQAQRVREQGVPQSLIDAMQNAAKEAQWRRLPPNGGTFDMTPILVDGTPHF